MDYNFHIQNYYTLKRIKNEYSTISILNKNDLKFLIEPFIINLINKLYHLLSSRVIDEFTLDLIPNSEKIVVLLTKEFNNSNLISDSKHDNLDKLFTSAFKKFHNRIFEKDGYNDEKHIIQTYIQYWLEDNLARLITKDERFSNLLMINMILAQTEMLHYFYTALRNYLPKKWITKKSEEWTKVTGDYSDLLDYIRTFDSEYFKVYEQEIKGRENLTTWKYIIETTRGSDYAMLNTEYSFRNIVLLNKDINLWIKFWDNLKLPILQDIVFNYLCAPTDYLKIAKALNENKTKLYSKPKNLALLLLKNLFDSIERTQENLTFYVDEERIKNLSDFEKDEDLIAQGQSIYTKWIKQRKNIYTEVLSELTNILSYNEISEWVFSYKPRDMSFGNKHNKMHNEEVEHLVTSFNSYFSSISLDERLEGLYQNFSLQNFNALLNKVGKSSIDSVKANKILIELSEFVNSDNFYWDRTFSEMYWQSMKNIGKLLSLCENPVETAIILVEQFKAINEGWKISEIDYKIYQREAYILCGAMLLLEHKEAFNQNNNRRWFFEKILTHVLLQIRFSSHGLEDYLMPIHLLSLIINQLLPSFKRRFETLLIQGVDELTLLLKILTNEGYKISDKSAKSLLKRIDIEIPFIKRKLLQKKQKDKIEEIELMIEKLKLFSIRSIS